MPHFCNSSQDSIHAFAFDLEFNNKANSIKGSPISFFMGILQKGFPYAPPENYESPQDRARRVFVERQKALLAKSKALKEESFNLAFEEWVGTHSEEQLKGICLKEGIQLSQASDPNSMLRKGSLQLHFKNKIWPEYEDKILNHRNEDKAENKLSSEN